MLRVRLVALATLGIAASVAVFTLILTMFRLWSESGTPTVASYAFAIALASWTFHATSRSFPVYIAAFVVTYLLLWRADGTLLLGVLVAGAHYFLIDQSLAKGHRVKSCHDPGE